MIQSYMDRIISAIPFKVETIRKITGEARSAFVKKALEAALKEYDRGNMIADYEKGYRRLPETPEEIRAAEAAAVELLAGEPWE